MKNYQVTLEVTKFGTDDERVELTYQITSRSDGSAQADAIDEAYKDGYYVDDAKILECKEI